MNAYSELSIQITEKLEEDVKKKEGIFFSPQKSIIRCLNYIKNILKYDFTTVLEPSCGSCEFIHYLDQNYQGLDITGIEFNKTIYHSIKGLTFQNKVNLIHQDYLTYNEDKRFDLILGNPPYFVLKKKDINTKYHTYLSGRPNIFLIFIIQSLKMLTTNGILAFILPKSFLNCSYYQKVREYIYHNYHVKTILDCSTDEYIETQQNTFILIVKNTNKSFSNDKYFLENNFIMNTKENIQTMKTILVNSSTLHQLGFKVFNGNLVWNQERDSLTNDNEHVRLIYCGDIKNNELEKLETDTLREEWEDYESKLLTINTLLTEDEKNKELLKKKKTIQNKIDKKHYVIKERLLNKKIGGLTLVINRGYGNTNYTLNYTLIDLDEYYLENHVLGIKYTGDTLSKEILEEKYQMIIKSLQKEDTMKFINLCMGNNAMNTTESEYLIPIFE